MTNAFVSNPEIQEEIARVVAQLKSLSVDETLAYHRVRGSRYALDRARIEVEKMDGIRFGTVRKLGVKRLAAGDVPAIGTAGTRRIHKAAKRTVARLSNLRGYNDMEPAVRLRVAAIRMVAHSVVERTTRSAVKAAEDTVRTAGSAVDFGDALPKRKRENSNDQTL